MALVKIADLYPDYKEEIFGGDDLKSFSVYDFSNEKIGSVHDILVDETGHFRYLVIDTGFWIFGKKVLLPVGRAKVDYGQERVYVDGLTKEQAESLPEYDDNMTLNYDYEERVRNVYRGVADKPNNYNYDRDLELYQINRSNHGDVYDYEQNLLNNRDRFKIQSGVDLYKISDLYPNYHSIFDNDDLMSYSLYSDSNEKVGSVKDILVDRDGHFRYLVVDTGFWILGKEVLLPFGRAKVDRAQKRIYANGLTKEQVEHLPEYNSDLTIDYDYEERVRNIYRGVEYDPNSTVDGEEAKRYKYNSGYDIDPYNYDREPSLYAHQETENNQSLKLYEERLVANKERFRTGAVTIGKRVESQTATVSVPIEKEKVIIQRSNPTNYDAVAPGEATFSESEVARVEVYEESADIEKQTFVREEVSVRKEVETDVVSAEETIRREELDIDTEGNAVIDK